MIAKELVTLLRFRMEKAGLNQFLNGLNQARTRAQAAANDIRRSFAAMRLQQRNSGAIYNRSLDRLGIRSDKQIYAEIRRAELAYTAFRRTGMATHAELARALAGTRKQIRELRGELSGGNDGASGGGLGAGLKSFLIGLGRLKTAMSFANTSDQISGAVAQASLYADKGNENAVIAQIFKNAQATGTDWQAGVDMYGSVARSKKALGLDDAAAVQLSDLVSKAVATTSKGAGQDSAAILQFSQALASGVLRGDELNSILENSGGLAMAIADAFGVGVGELRDMGKAGKLSSKEMAEGLLKQVDKINDKFAKMPKTFGSGMTKIRNAWARWVFEINRSTGAGEKFYRVCSLIADNIGQIAKAAAFLGAAYGIYRLNNALAMTVGNAGSLNTLLFAIKESAKLSLLPFLKIAAVLYGIYLIVDDIIVWLNGGQSVLGELIGSSAEWQTQIDWVKEKLGWVWEKLGEIKDVLGGAGQTTGKWLMKIAALVSVGMVVFKVLMLLFGATKVVALGIRLITAAMAANPILLAIMAVIAAIWLLYNNWDTVVAYLLAAWDWVKAKASAAWQAITAWALATWERIKAACLAAWNAVWQSAVQMWDNITQKAISAWQAISSSASSIWGGIINTVNGLWDTAIGYFKDKWAAAVAAVRGWFDWIPGLGGGSINVNHTVSAAAMTGAGVGVRTGGVVNNHVTQNITANGVQNPARSAVNMARGSYVLKGAS